MKKVISLAFLVVALVMLMCGQITVSQAEGTDDSNRGVEVAKIEFEEGRYAVGTGKPIASDNNIRSRSYIPVKNPFVLVSIASPYSVTIHQYRTEDYSSFIVSQSGIQGGGIINLDGETKYINLSIKKTDNADIAPEEGQYVKIYESGYEDLIEINESGIAREKALLTIIDDDGNVDYYRDVYPMALEKGVSISAAVPAGRIGNDGYMTWEMVKECRNNGMEILCHTYSHILATKIGELTQDDFELDYSRALEVFSQEKIDAELLVFSGSTGLYAKAQNPAQQLFKGAFLAGDNQTNFIGGDPYKIKRYRIGSDYPFEVDTLIELIDKLNDTGGWMVWMMHTSSKSTWNSDVPRIIGEVIDYAKELNISIVTAQQGFEIYYELLDGLK